MAIVAVGSLAFDSIKTETDSRERILGGSLTHFANAAYFYSKPRLVGVVGEDFGKDEWAFLKKKSSAVEGVETLAGEKSFFWSGVYSPNFDDRTSLATDLNAFAKFAPKVPEDYRKDDYILFLANIDPETQLKVIRQCESSSLKVLDTMNYWIDNTPDQLNEVFKNVEGIIINEEEARALSGEVNLMKAAEKLFLPNFKLLILKKGSNGVMIFGKDGMISLPAYPVKDVVDPTGAGDSFAGAFLSYLDARFAEAMDMNVIKDAAVYATVVASFCVQGFGVDGIDSVSEDDVKKRIEEFKSISGF